MRRNAFRYRAIAALLALTANSGPAVASDYSFPTGMKVTIELGETPLFRSGSNVVYPVQSHFSVEQTNENQVFEVARKDGAKLTLIPDGARYLIQEQIAVGDEVTFEESGSMKPKPVRVLISGPLAIGHVHFMAGSAKLSDAAKTVLTQTATQMNAAGLVGAYLVGTSDRAGSSQSNLTLSERRVMRVAAFLQSALVKEGVLSPEIQTEFMGEYLSLDKDGTHNILDRKVSVLIYPKM